MKKEASTVPPPFFFNLFLSLFAEFLSLPCISTSPLSTFFLEYSAIPSWVRWTVRWAVLVAAWVFFPVQSLVFSLPKNPPGQRVSFLSLPSVVCILL